MVGKMKKFKKQKLFKQIIGIIIVLMLCNFIIPNCSYALSTDGGDLFNPISKFITYLCDSIMQYLQSTFTSNQSISNGDGTFNFQYSPAIIFSGTVQGLDINFIKPNTDERNSYNFEVWLKAKREDFGAESTQYKWEDYEKIEIPENCYRIKEEVGEAHLGKIADYYIYYKIENNYIYIYYFAEYYASSTEPTLFYYYETNYELTDEFLNEMNGLITYTSIAYELQPTIATWYNALRRIALVGLLSVLVYLGIRILISSSSPEGNSKYKKMLTDWLVALCLLFTLHYIMSFTLVVTKELSAVFNIGTEDTLLGGIRQKIEGASSWAEATTNVVMYVILTIYTVVFTYRYLKRVLYMAFFTMIAPLITLTYPIDKVKDGKAQAFSMWIKEYIFNALIQVAHLVIYYALVGSVTELITIYPIFAIIVMFFMAQAENIVRKMFGFNNSETLGTVGAVTMGGLISSAMKKLKSLPKPKKSENKDKSSSGTNNKVRTATK